MLEKRICAVAMILFPDNCHTWKSCIFSIPWTWWKIHRIKTLKTKLKKIDKSHKLLLGLINTWVWFSNSDSLLLWQKRRNKKQRLFHTNLNTFQQLILVYFQTSVSKGFLSNISDLKWTLFGLQLVSKVLMNRTLNLKQSFVQSDVFHYHNWPKIIQCRNWTKYNFRMNVLFTVTFDRRAGFQSNKVHFKALIVP